MEPLPFVDEHRWPVTATVARTWDAVVRLVHGRLSRPAPARFAALWRLEPASGFAISDESAPHRVALRGRRRFCRYELELSVEDGPGIVTIRARTCAEFPGVAGSTYRALVIGSGGHGWVVRQLLRKIAASAEGKGRMATVAL